MADNNSYWDHAAKAGLALGGASIVYLAVTALLGLVKGGGDDVSVAGNILLSLVNFILWLAKFLGCIYLMRFFLQKFASSEPEAGRTRVFRFGSLVGLLSAVVYSAANLAYSTLIAPDMYDSLMDIYRSMPQFTDEMLSTAEQIVAKMPTTMFFTNIIYCWLYGTVLSAILSRKICPDNPF